MSKLFFICSFFLIAHGTTQSQNYDNRATSCAAPETASLETTLPYAIDEIVFIEDTEEFIDLGFDTASYLPEGFDPYASEYEGIEYIEEPYKIDFGFDTAMHLPKDFNPYKGMNRAEETKVASSL